MLADGEARLESICEAGELRGKVSYSFDDVEDDIKGVLAADPDSASFGLR